MSEFDPRPAHDAAPEPSVDADLEVDLADFVDEDFFDEVVEVRSGDDTGDSQNGSPAAAELEEAADPVELTEDRAESPEPGQGAELGQAASVADSGPGDPAAAPAADFASAGVDVAGSGVDSASTAAAAAPAIAAPDSPIGAALAALDTLSDRELAEHPDVYQRIHAELQSALSAIDDA